MSSTAISFDSFSTILENLQSQIDVTHIVPVLATLAGSVVGLVFMWWGVRKLVRVLMAAFKKGKISL